MSRLLVSAFAAVGLAAAATASAGSAQAEEWSLAKAAEPYKGTEISAIFLDRPGYRAIIKLLPEFESATG
ncbi:MAG: sugar ABC transporter substrate-binding protein, partial [Bauldia sp.]